MPSPLVESWRQKCRLAPGRIGLPESCDPRILHTVSTILRNGTFSQVFLFEPQADVMTAAQAAGVDLTPVADRIIWFADEAPPPGEGRSRLDQCAELLHAGQIDVALAGAVSTTAQVIRAAIANVGLAPGCRTISGLFMMNKVQPDGREHTMAYADSGVVIDPTPEQLADIAWSTVESWSCAMDTGQPPVVAFLSFSTQGSAKHAAVDKVVRGLEIFRQRHPEVEADGELQFDAAFVAEIGQRKSPGSRVPGRANCFVFPNLDAGNIAYKITQRLAGYEAYGPILQGARKPFSDLSRGASPEDIAASAYINLLRARI